MSLIVCESSALCDSVPVICNSFPDSVANVCESSQTVVCEPFANSTYNACESSAICDSVCLVAAIPYVFEKRILSIQFHSEQFEIMLETSSQF